MNIGSWVRRRDGRWHLVESVIADAAITRCGRRMEPEHTRGCPLFTHPTQREPNRAYTCSCGGNLQVSEVMPLTRMIDQPQNCKRCSR